MEIKVKHPIEEYNIKQQDFINQLSNETDKEYHCLLFSFGNATIYYHKLEIEPTLKDYNEWLEGLDPNIRQDMYNRGFDNCKNILSFTRYVREKRDIGMEQFVREKMGEETYKKYKLIFDNK